jgi:hypothetical protein
MSSVKSVTPQTIPSTVPASPAIDILQTHSIPSFAVAHYLLERRILLSVAQRYCVEAQYLIDKKAFYTPGFRSDAGGYLLTNRYREYSTEPQDLTHIQNDSSDIAILTHPLNLTTLASLLHYASHPLPNMLVIPFPDSALPILSSTGNDNCPRPHHHRPPNHSVPAILPLPYPPQPPLPRLQNSPPMGLPDRKALPH